MGEGRAGEDPKHSKSRAYNVLSRTLYFKIVDAIIIFIIILLCVKHLLSDISGFSTFVKIFFFSFLLFFFTLKTCKVNSDSISVFKEIAIWL